MFSDAKNIRNIVPHRILRIRQKAGWDVPGELSHHKIDIYKYADGHYVAKFKIQSEMGEIVAIGNKLPTEITEGLLERLQTLKIPIAPNCHPGWEELEKITNEILVHTGFYSEKEESGS